MTLNVHALPDSLKKDLLELGRRYSSEETLAQADQTLSAFNRYKKQLLSFGAQQSDADLLEEARAQLTTALSTRAQAKAAKSKTVVGIKEAIQDAKAIHVKTTVVLKLIVDDLQMKGDNTLYDSMTQIKTALSQMQLAGVTPTQLLEQLGHLKKMLESSTLADALKTRNGTTLAKDVESAMNMLRSRSADHQGSLGTTAETELLDLLDGIIVTRARLFRDVAEAAARVLGEEAILDAFALSYLSSKPTKKNASTKPPAPSPT